MTLLFKHCVLLLRDSQHRLTFLDIYRFFCLYIGLEFIITVSADAQGSKVSLAINSSLPGQNSSRFANDIFKCIFLNEKFCISIWISLKFVPEGAIHKKRALVQVMAWRGVGNKPLPEPVLIQFTDEYICVTKGRWVNVMGW